MDIEKLLKPQAPERMYGWLDSQMSIARHYGGLKYMGHSYVIDYADPDHPLVRQDILEAEKKAAKAAKKATSKMTRAEMSELQELMQAFGAQQGVKFSAPGYMDDTEQENRP